NAYGQLGDGTFASKNVPVQIGTATNWQTIIAGSAQTIAIKTNGTLWGWGNNGSGQLVNTGTTNINTPTQIGTDTNWKTAALGITHTLAIKTN
ncbi:hypothetical protein SB725_30895, partial [Pseudomonas sp. SIMBA_041]